jgi:hypothetical protein
MYNHELTNSALSLVCIMAVEENQRFMPRKVLFTGEYRGPEAM